MHSMHDKRCERRVEVESGYGFKTRLDIKDKDGGCTIIGKERTEGKLVGKEKGKVQYSTVGVERERESTV